MNIKIIFGLFLLLRIFGLQVNAQTLNDNDIIGTWTVVKVNNLIELPEEQKETMEMLKNAFLKSKFEFKPDKNFSFDFEFEDVRIKDCHWKYNDVTKSFIIQEWKDKETDNRKLMEIFTKKEDGKIIFLLSESFITLEMIKKE